MHNIQYDTLPGNWDRAKVTAWVQDEVSHSGDCYGTDRITIIPGLCKDYQEAQDRIERYDKGGYEGYMVKYLEREWNKTTPKIEELSAKYNETNQKKGEFVRANMPNRVKAELIGCKKCGSKIAKKYLSGACCPVCREDLRSDTVKERLKSFDARLAKIQEDIRKERQKLSGKEAWLVKWEYHS